MAYLFIRGSALDAGGLPTSEYEALAKNIIRRSLHIQPKENVIVECWNHTLDAAKEVVYQLRAAGARPMFLMEDEETYWRSVETLPTAKLGQVSAPEWAALSKADAYVFFPGPADLPRHRKNLPKSAAAAGYNSEWYRRAGKAGLRGARVLLGYVSRERAQTYGYDFDAWRERVLRASSIDFGPISRKGKKPATLPARDGEGELAAPNGDEIRKEYDKATGAKDRLGWLQVGLNPEVEYGFLQDDLVAGAVEIGIGDNTDYGGKNTSGFSFQGRLTNATVRIGKKVVVDHGHLAA